MVKIGGSGAFTPYIPKHKQAKTKETPEASAETFGTSAKLSATDRKVIEGISINFRHKPAEPSTNDVRGGGGNGGDDRFSIHVGPKPPCDIGRRILENFKAPHKSF